MGRFTAGSQTPGAPGEGTAEGTAGYVAELMGVLQAQRTTLTALLDVADRQQGAIMERDREAIEATTKEQDELFAELQGLEYDREQVQRALSGHVAGGSKGSGDPGLDFDRMLQALPPGDRVMLTAARDEARRLLASLSSINRVNQQLLAQELALFDMYMSVLNPDMSAEAYSDPGQGRRGSASAAIAFDTRA